MSCVARTFVAAFLISLGVSSAHNLPAQPAAPAITPAIDAADLARRLSSDDWKDRQGAEEELVRSGDNARPVIDQMLAEAKDPETRSRLESALRRIDENRVSGTSFITLHLKDATPQQAFAEISRQAHVSLRTSPENLWDHGQWAKVSIEMDHQPFWVAVRELTKKTGVTLGPWNDGLRIMHGAGAGGPAGAGLVNGPFYVSGPFLVVATQITRSQAVALALGEDGRPVGQNRQNDFALQLNAYPEPKLSVIRSASQVIIEEAVDDKGNSLLSDDPQARQFSRGVGAYPGGGNGLWMLHARLLYPENPGRRIAKLRGRTSFAVLTKSTQVEVPDVLNAKDVSQSIAGVPVIIRGLTQAGETYELKLGVNQASMRRPDLWAQIQQAVQTGLRLVDGQGQPLDRRSFGSRAMNNDIEFTLQFVAANRPQDGRRSGPPSKLLWNVPTETKDVEVTFEFTDLPMP